MTASQEQPHEPLYQKTVLIPSIREKVHMVEEFLATIECDVAIREEVLDNVMISVTEAVNNGIIHGNQADPDKNVTLTFRCFPDVLEFVIEDEGAGFNPANLPDPFHEDNLLKEGGRGVLIINAMMDDVRYERRKTGMRITMRIHR